MTLRSRTSPMTPVEGTIVGAVGVALICVAMFPFRTRFGAEIPGLLLLLPIAVTAVASGRRAAIVLAAIAGVANSLLFLEPFGAIRVGFTQDVVTFVTFSGVAAAVSWAASRRPPAPPPTVDEGRLLLLRGVGHDLRNPLHAIRLASSDLLDDEVHDEQSRSELLGVVLDESNRMERIVANLLSLSRVQAGALQPEIRPVELRRLLDDCCSRFERLNPGTVEVTAVHGLTVAVDPIQIDQLLSNIVENALRVNPPDGRIQIAATRHGQRVRLDVDDDGPGFTDGERPGIAPHRSGAGSSGLGLVVSRAIAEAHGGTLVLGVSPSGGARVSFDLPLGP